MPLLRQLEFAFRTVAGVADPDRFATSPDAGVGAPGYSTIASQENARELLRSLGAARVAKDLRVEWNSRLKTAAGRADYREKLISLNPQLIEHPREIDRTLRHELAHILAQFRAGRRRISPHGVEWRKACIDLGIADEKRCHNLPFPARTYAARFVYRCPNCRQEFPRVRRVRRAVACLACCRKHNSGHFDPRFRLKLVRWSRSTEPSAGDYGQSPLPNVMSSEVETSLDASKRRGIRNIQRFLDSARNDKTTIEVRSFAVSPEIRVAARSA